MTALRLRGVITSRDNAKLRLLRRLQSRAQRHRLGLFACEGEDLVAAAAAAGLEPVELLVSARSGAGEADASALDRLRRGYAGGADVEPALLAEVSTLGHPPRVVAVYRTGDLPPFEPRAVGLALWRLGDPGNLGTLLRSADAFDAFVALSRGCADPTGPKALRASAGAIFRVPLGRFDDAPGRRVALAAHGGRPLAELDFDGPTTFVLGAERAGLPADVLARCAEIATIRTPGPAESLNVAAAGAIALYVRSSRVRTGD
jgi:TrmH family RNA methyltransferase